MDHSKIILKDSNKWTVVARYCSSNAWLLPRIAFAETGAEAKRKAEQRFPRKWCGYQLTQIIVMQYTPMYKGIAVKDLLCAPLPKFKRYKCHPMQSPIKIQRDRRVKHFTGREN